MEINRKPLSLPRLFFVLISASVLFIGGIILLADIKCHYDIENWWAQPYPGAETVSIEYDLFRARALGETRWILRTEDDEETVRKWYQDLTLQVLEEGRSRGLAWADRRVQALDGGGSQIVLFSACGT